MVDVKGLSCLAIYESIILTYQHFEATYSGSLSYTYFADILSQSLLPMH